MKKAITLILCSFYFIFLYGQSNGAIIVQRFGNNLKYWCSSKKIMYRLEAQRLCTEECRVNNEIIQDFVKNSGLNPTKLDSYVIPNYLNAFETALGKGDVIINIHNVRIIPLSEQERSYGISNTKQIRKYADECTAVSCDFSVSGALNYYIKELYYIRKGKIIRIKPREEVIDQRTGQTKIKVDYSDLFINNYETMGFSFNYGQHFPIGVSFNYSLEEVPFMLSVDLGINLDEDKYIIDKVNMKDIMNYERTKKVLDSKFFLTVTPQVYFKYLAIGCGIGFLYMDGTEETTNYSTTSNLTSNTENSNSTIVASGGSSSMSATVLKPMIRPIIKGFIPLSDEFYLSVSAGYDLIFGYKENNGFNFGIGIQWEL